MDIASASVELTERVDGARAAELAFIVRRLEKRTGVLRERAMRRAVLVEVVRDLDVVGLVGFLTLLLRRVRLSKNGARAVMQELALEPHVFTDLPYQTVQEAYALARAARVESVQKMFLSAAAAMNPTVDEAFKENEYVDLPSGLRRAQARNGTRLQLDRLLHDRNHRVIEILLNNPKLIERDVVKIAAMRPTRPEVLERVARHAKWSSRYHIRKALACNPYTPVPIARRLLATLMRQDLRVALEAGVLPEDLEDEVRRMLGTRGYLDPTVAVDAEQDAAEVDAAAEELAASLADHLRSSSASVTSDRTEG